MEPRIQYAKTSDGVNIAYSVIGEGAPFVHLPVLLDSHLVLGWRDPRLREFLERLASRRKVIRYDARGGGLSSREVDDVSLEAHLSDLDTVLGSVGVERAALFGAGQPSTLIAAAYTARQPQRVSQLILYSAISKGAELPRARGMTRLFEENWELFTDAMAIAVLGWSDPSEVKQWGERVRASMGQTMWRKYIRAVMEIDLSEQLPTISVPTLVIQRRELAGLEEAQRVAAAIPGAEFALVEGTEVMHNRGDWQSVLGAIEDFLDGKRSSSPELPPGTAIIGFFDIADSTALTESLGDSAFRQLARELDGILRTLIRQHGGTPVDGKLLGDGVLAVFTSAAQAIEAALACTLAGEAGGLPLHLGLHAGDVIREDNNVYGGAVNIASRISGLSAPGEVLVSATVRELARTSAGVLFEDRGEQALKGIEEPVRVWAVRQA